MPANFNPGWFDEHLNADGYWTCADCGEEFHVTDDKPETDCPDGVVCERCADDDNEDEEPAAFGFSLGAMLGGPMYGGE